MSSEYQQQLDREASEIEARLIKTIREADLDGACGANHHWIRGTADTGCFFTESTRYRGPGRISYCKPVIRKSKSFTLVSQSWSLDI